MARPSKGEGQNGRVRAAHRPRRDSTAWSISDSTWKKVLGEQAIGDLQERRYGQAKVLDVDVEKEADSPTAVRKSRLATDRSRRREGRRGAGQRATCARAQSEVPTSRWSRSRTGASEVKIAGTDLSAFIKRNELARDRGDEHTGGSSVGEKVERAATAPVESPPRARSRSRSRRSKSPRRRKQSRNMVRPTWARRSATSSAPRSRLATRPSSSRRQSRRTPPGSDSGGFFLAVLESAVTPESAIRQGPTVRGPAFRSRRGIPRRPATACLSPGRSSARPCLRPRESRRIARRSSPSRAPRQCANGCNRSSCW